MTLAPGGIYGGLSQLGAKAAAPWYLAGGIAAANCVGAWQGKGVASLAESKVNLVTPGTYDLTSTSEPTFNSSYGWWSNLATMFWDTGIVPLKTYGVIVKFTERITTAKMLFGANEFWIIPHYDASNHRYNFGGEYSYKNAPPAMTAGTLAIASLKGYTNGVADAAATSSGNPANTLYLFGRNVGNLLDQQTNVKIQAAAIYIAITDAQVLAVSNQMAAL